MMGGAPMAMNGGMRTGGSGGMIRLGGARKKASHKAAADEGYCVKCHDNRKLLNPVIKSTKNGRRMMIGKCSVCGNTVPRFLPNK